MSCVLTGAQCQTGPAPKMEPVAPPPDVSYEKSPKGQVRRPTRPEHVIAFEFLKIHYEEDVKAEVPVQKSDVYHDYEQYCTKNSFKPLVAADFGRILKSMFPNARDRRLGSRGSSKYCYVGVKRKSESNTKTASMNPYTAEDLAKAYQTIVCEWASTVLSRRMSNMEELAKYLLRNRFVQTRSCAALTITASMKDSDGNIRELSDPLPVNKHRETQLKLQEKLREKLLNKQFTSRGSSSDDTELRLAQRSDSAYVGSHTGSTASTPDPDGQNRQTAQPCSAPGSAPNSCRTSPEHAAMSVTNSACTSPVFVDGQLPQKPAYPLNYRNGFGGNPNENGVVQNGGLHSGSLTPMQCNSTVSSKRTTPIPPLYTQQMSHSAAISNTVSQSQYQFDPRIQSCPTTPLPSFQQQRFDFPQLQMNRGPPQAQCLSLPNSARNTPVQQDYYETVENTYYAYPPADDSQNLGQQQDLQYDSQTVPNYQRHEFGRNNSAFIPIKDGGHDAPENLVNYVHNAFSDAAQYQHDKMTIDYSHGGSRNHSHNDSDELEINELFNIIDHNSGSTSHVQMLSQQSSPQQQKSVDSGISGMDRSRPTSAQGAGAQSLSSSRPEISNPSPHHINHHPALPNHTSAHHSSLIYDLLTSGPNQNAAAHHHRYRHHSGPQLGYAASQAKGNFMPTSTIKNSNSSSTSAVDLNSPPSTPNGNFRPVLTPNRELRMHYGSDSHFSSRGQSPSAMPPALSQRMASSLVGTMSPPAQPLTKRKRQHSGEAVGMQTAAGKLVNGMHTTHAQPAQRPGDDSDYVARRNLGNQLASPQIPNEELARQ